MTIELRTVPSEDLRKWLEAIEIGLELRRDRRVLAVRREHDRARSNHRRLRRRPVVGGGAAFSFELTVPGGRAVKAAGVTNVGVSPRIDDAAFCAR